MSKGRTRILVSACLLGCICRYDGQCRKSEPVMALLDRYDLIPVCPEQLGGLPTPRPPAEIVGDKVIRKDGEDVTLKYFLGAWETARLCDLLHPAYAILKSKSPSCGIGRIYDGTFSGTLVPGDGITVRELRKKNVRLLTEHDVEDHGLLYLNPDKPAKE